MNTEHYFKSVTRLRIALEEFAAGEIMRSAALKKKAAGALSALTTDFRRALKAEDYEAFNRTDYRLHHTLVELPGLPVLVENWEAVWEVHAGLHRDRLREYWPNLRILVEEQEYLIEVLCSFDPVAIQDAIHNHLESLWFRIYEGYAAPPAEPENPLPRVRSYLSYHLHRPLDLREIARNVAFTSPGHLSRLMRQQCGAGFKDYVRNLRMEKGEELLRRTRLPVRQIARRTGYPSASRFCEYFKRTYGMTPTAYRRKHPDA
ncbi:helix-turn-helix transcriptional regulator [Kiritimatiella glycovorans]|uniref:AraC family transcriptional regulator n=1 Tax=Kiritimatiella glycovorans TaxID=1307763 RepID=A0A0G3EF16_9BACT|nr:helix-turn-helix domain-containing protein [Kiritimatiella glycovorans]AKJ64923.1 AraC family transcriptional regulator [Kiritimatiella glycovorans]